MMAKARSTCSLLSLLAGLAPALPAQLPAGISHQAANTGIPWPASIGAGGAFEQIVTGRFTHNWTDAIVRKGGQLGQAIGIGALKHIAVLPTAAAVTGMVVGRAVTPSGHDVLVWSGQLPAGLVVESWDPVTMQRTTTPQSVAAWAGASQLGMAMGLASHDLVGVDSTGQMVLRAQYGAVVSHVSTTPTGHTIRQCLLADRNGDGILESFVRHDDAVRIYSTNGTLLTTIPLADPDAFLVRSGSRVLLIERNAADTGYVLRFIVGAGTITSWPEILGHTFLNAVAAETDKSGEQDLLIGLQSSQQALSVRFVVNANALEAQVDTVDLTATPNQPNNGALCPLHAADVDGDGYSDLVYASTQLALLMLKVGIAHALELADPIDPVLHQDSVFNNAPQGMDFGALLLRLQGELFEDYDRVQVTMWWEVRPGSGEALVATSNEIYTITAFPAGASHSLRIDAWEDYAATGVLHLLIGFSNDPVPGESVQQPLFTVSGFALDQNSLGYMSAMTNYLNSIQADNAAPIEIHHPQGPGSITPGRVITGGLRQVPVVDPFDPPDPGPAGTGKSTVPVAPPTGG